MFYELAQKIIRNYIHIDHLIIFVLKTTLFPDLNKKTLDNLIRIGVK